MRKWCRHDLVGALDQHVVAGPKLLQGGADILTSKHTFADLRGNVSVDADVTGRVDYRHGPIETPVFHVSDGSGQRGKASDAPGRFLDPRRLRPRKTLVAFLTRIHLRYFLIVDAGLRARVW